VDPAGARYRDVVRTAADPRRVRDGVGFAEKIFHLADTGTCCPADEPTPVTLGSPPDPPLVDDRSAGAGVRIVVIDTGFYRRARRLLPWMRGVRGDRDVGIGQNVIAQYAGHGTFIAGVIRTVAPSADVIVRAGFQPEGVVAEKDLVKVLEWVLLNDAPDIINISGGTLADEDGPQLMFEFYERRMRYHKGIALVVAAGNDGDRRHFWPAAAAWALSVGALAANWRDRAEFSNYGGWVDVFAPGEHIVNAFPIGRYRYNEPPRAGRFARFAGMASWSGTSFSAPMVAGLIAARMSRTGENGTEAAAAVLRTASRQALLGVGPVLLPTTDVRGKRH
jgi:subtilisin family serine protease